MRLSRIVVWQLDLPLTEPYFLSGRRLKFEKLDSSFVRLETDEGVIGWGEACPWGHTYLPAHGPGVRAGLQTLAPVLLGQDPLALDGINRLMDITLPGHAYVKSAVDMACWDILGQVSGQPLWKLFGGAESTPVEVNSSISTGSPEEMLKKIELAASQGYRTHSAKVGGDDVETDIARIDTISEALQPGHKITFDVNRAWTPGVAVQILNSVSAQDWIEQPCETLAQCAHVAARVDNPIMLDECLHTYMDHLDAWRLAACEGVKVKPNRLGGLTKARQIRDLGVHLGWQMHIEDVGGSVLADTAALHLASSTPQQNRLASWLCHYHLATDPAPGQGARNINGLATPPSSPGLGVVPKLDMLGDPVADYR